MEPLRSRCLAPFHHCLPLDADAESAAPLSRTPSTEADRPPRRPAGPRTQALREAMFQRQLEQKLQARAYLDRQLDRGAVAVEVPEHWRSGSLQLGPSGESLTWHGNGRKEVLDLATAVRQSHGRGLWGLLPPAWRRAKPAAAHWPVPGLYSLSPCGFNFAVGRDAEDQPWLVQVSPQGTEIRSRTLLPNLLALAAGTNAVDAAGELLLGWYPSTNANERQLCLVDLTRYGRPMPLAIWGPVPHATAQQAEVHLQAQLSRDGAWLCLNQSPTQSQDCAELFKIQRQPVLRLERERLFEQVHSARLSPSGRYVFVDPAGTNAAELHHRTGGTLQTWHQETLHDVKVAQARWSPGSEAVVGSHAQDGLIRFTPLQTARQAPLPAAPSSQTYALPGEVDQGQLGHNLLISEDGNRALVPLCRGRRKKLRALLPGRPSGKFALLSFVAAPANDD